MKLLAINGLAELGAEEAIPMLQKMLQGTGSPQAEGARALRPRAEQLAQGARGHRRTSPRATANPDLQMKAVQYLGIHGGRESRAALADIYAASSDVDMKKRILQRLHGRAARRIGC